MTYRHRRLRKRLLAPPWIITSTRPITRETAENLKIQWRQAARLGKPLIVDGTYFEVRGPIR